MLAGFDAQEVVVEVFDPSVDQRGKPAGVKEGGVQVAGGSQLLVPFERSPVSLLAGVMMIEDPDVLAGEVGQGIAADLGRRRQHGHGSPLLLELAD